MYFTPSRSLSMSQTGNYSRRTMGMTVRFSFIEKQTTSLFERKALDHPKGSTASWTINHDQGDQTSMEKDQEEVRAGQKDFRRKLQRFSQINFGHGFNNKQEWKGLRCFLRKAWVQNWSLDYYNLHAIVFNMEEGDNSNIVFNMGNG